MNGHLEQSLITSTEAIEVMGVPKNFISPQGTFYALMTIPGNKPVMGIVQDSLSAAYYLTLRDTFLTRERVMQMIGFLDSWDGKLPPPCILKPKPLWTGKQVFSVVLGCMNLLRYSGFHPFEEDPTPNIDSLSTEEIVKKLNDTFKTQVNPDDRPTAISTLKSLEEQRHLLTPSDTRVLISDGQLLSGILCKKTLGTTPGSLIHVVALDGGPTAITKFVNDVQRVNREHMYQLGMSIGIDDMLVPPGNERNVNNILEVAGQEMERMRKSGISADEFESRTNKLLNDARKKICEDTMDNKSMYNSFKAQIWSGSKGSIINPAQVERAIGQNNVEGKRIPYSYTGRCLPHFKKGDDSPCARGFIKNNYMNGLTPQEFFFHAVAGREGIIDTAVKTSETGYGQRRLCKAMEDIMVRYDGTVRNSLGDVVQFSYGEDGLDATYQEWQTIPTIGISKDKLEKRYKWDDVSLQKHEILLREWNRLQKDSTLVVVKQNMPIPVHFQRLLENIPKPLRTGMKESPSKLAQDLFDLQVELWKVLPQGTEKWDSPFAIHLRGSLASKRLYNKWNITTDAWEWVKARIVRLFKRSIVSPGEAVGTLAGQSIVEPATQMTLRTFHHIGQSEKNVTLGVPRLKELVNAAKKTKTPSLTIYLKKPYNKSKDVAEEVMKRMINVTLREVVDFYEVVYDVVGEDSCIPEDRSLIGQFVNVPDFYTDDDMQLSDWVLRFQFDTNQLRKYRVRMTDIINYLRQSSEECLHMEYNDEYCEPCVVRIRAAVEKNSKPGDDEYLLRDIANILIDGMSVSGVSGIKRTYLQRDPKTQEYVIETDGSNLAEIFGVFEVDFARTICNDTHESLSILGVEAARTTLIRELEVVLSFDNGYVNKRHPMLLADIMTHGGGLMSITRHGLNRRIEYGPFPKCSFEETSEVLHEAARFSQIDNLKGVTEAIIMGTHAPIGTHTFDLFLNTGMLDKCSPPIDETPIELALSNTSSGPTAVRPKAMGPFRFKNPAFGPVKERTQPDGEYVPPSPTHYFCPSSPSHC